MYTIGKMAPENGKLLPDCYTAGMNFEETKLTLGMPGETHGVLENGTKLGTKRAFFKTIDLNLGRPTANYENKDNDESGNGVSSTVKPPTKAQVVGWPPVRAYRKNATKGGRFVKVAVDGAPYLRKVDLEVYESYQQLLNALEGMFSCFTIRNYLKEGKIMDEVNGVEYATTYEDKDGDWMMVGDVPWKMFVESCNRLRLMKSSEAIGLATRTPSKC